MSFPPDHGQRRELHDEVHARPTVGFAAPVRLTTIALLTNWTQREAQDRHLCQLLRSFGQAEPRPDATHLACDLGPFRIKWERHTEFTRYIFVANGADHDPFARTALDLVPRDWVAGLPGEVIFAAHGAVLPMSERPSDNDQVAARFFGGDPLIGSSISAGRAVAFTDFRIDASGFSRFLVYDLNMSRMQTARNIQRLFEIEIYRMVALLALPVARALDPELGRMEQELVAVTAELAGADTSSAQRLLDRLIALSAAIERHQAATHFRFSAAEAYHELVLRRIADLREERIEGLQTFEEFLERRLAPAMATCRSMAARLEKLSLRVARATQLLSTQVELVREHQNQAILASLNQRARLQLMLQQAVEGLSVAAMTYYGTGLLSYALKGLKALHLDINTDMVTAAGIPIIAFLLFRAVRRVHHSTAAAGDEHDHA